MIREARIGDLRGEDCQRTPDDDRCYPLEASFDRSRHVGLTDRAIRRLLALLAPSPHGWSVELAHEIVLQGSAAGYAVRVGPFPLVLEHPSEGVLAYFASQHQGQRNQEKAGLAVVKVIGPTAGANS